MQQNPKSYYHCVDSRYPLCSLTLPEIYERRANNDNGHGVFWYDRNEFLTYAQIFRKVQQ